MIKKVTDTHKAPDKITFVTVKDRKVLFALETGNTIWYTPGGKRRTGESDSEVLCREVKEELSVDIQPDTIQHLTTLHPEVIGKPGTFFNMICYTADYDGKLQPNSEIQKIDFISHKDKNLVAQGGSLLLNYLKENDVID